MKYILATLMIIFSLPVYAQSIVKVDGSSTVYPIN